MAEQTGRLPYTVHPKHHRPARVLLVDDDPALLEALSGTLQLRLGHFTLDTCATGMEALDRLNVTPYDTVISDVNMPGMNGLQFLTRASKARPMTPVVLISGYADRALISKAIEGGASDFIAKPIERDMLMLTIRQTLNLSRIRTLMERQHAILSRTRDHYQSMVKKLGNSNNWWLNSVETVLKESSVSALPGALLRHDQTDERMTIFINRATRHLAMLDAFLVKTTTAHRHTSKELSMAEETLRRLALTRLQDSF